MAHCRPTCLDDTAQRMWTRSTGPLSRRTVGTTVSIVCGIVAAANRSLKRSPDDYILALTSSITNPYGESSTLFPGSPASAYEGGQFKTTSTRKHAYIHKGHRFFITIHNNTHAVDKVSKRPHDWFFSNDHEWPALEPVDIETKQLRECQTRAIKKTHKVQILSQRR